MSIDPDLIKLLANSLGDDPDVIDETAFDGMSKGKKTSVNQSERTPNIGMLSESVEKMYTNCCRNRVYRRGIVMACGKSCNSSVCESCEVALEAKRRTSLGISEAKKEPSNKPDDLDVDEDFEVHDDYDDSKKKPGEPGKQKRKSSLQDGPDGEKGTKKSPYLK